MEKEIKVEKKKCTKCQESRKKITPYIIGSVAVLGLIIYAVVDITKEIIELLSH